ncbi:MAG: glycoside hydrolase family 15 protein [Deltaproteobacteria bacterium]|nr:glycoside hydrolase family 15 protein [Deltaproteobacteria bacterium]
MRLEDLGLVGNCQFAALVHRDGSVVWCCLPRFDAEPVFAALLDEREGGRFRVAPASGAQGVSRYLTNTNVLETTFEDADGAFRVVDFAPRFELYDRSFRPTQLFRVVEPLRGHPRIRVECDPRMGWSKRVPPALQGSNHVRFEGFPAPLRLTTDVPVSYLGGQPFALTGRRHLVLAWGAPIEEPLAPLCDRFLAETVRHWQLWVKRCTVPPHYQPEVIRSALALKLHCFEDTGAIVAATTTSIPEAPGSGRTWDYRYCWLRDAYYTLGAFALLGQFEERERFIQWLFDVAGGSPELDLAPLYRIDGKSDLAERVLADWPGYRGEGPVRVGNGAAEHRQNDIFGETVLALAPVFLDERFRDEQSAHTLALLTRLARKAVSVAGTPDAGIWEHRTDWRPQTFSSLMSWAAADRMAVVLERHRPDGVAEFRGAATAIRAQVLEQAWSAGRGAFAATYGGEDLDASLLQMVPLRFLPRGDPRLGATVDAIARDLGRDGWLWRYRVDDGLGRPEVAFVLCTFWLVEALAGLGRLDEARAVFDRARGAASPLGLLSEDYAPSGERWGNFPQAYSHVGLIHGAFEASPRWAEVS